MPSILLIGAGGFVGSAVREAAERRGVALRSASRRAAPLVDILRPETLEPAMRGIDTVVHAAGAAHVFRRTPATDDWLRRTNVEGTRNVVAAARRSGVGHVVLVSSVSVHGRDGEVYAESKREAERVAVEEAGSTALTILRLATVYGEGDRGNVFRLIRAVDRHRFIWIGRGDNRKSLIHRDDAGEAILTAALAGIPGVFDVSAPPVTMREIVAAIAQALGRRVPRIAVGSRFAMTAARTLAALTLRNPRAVAFERTIAKWCRDEVHDAAEFYARFGFTPSVDLAGGIAREVAWYRSRRQ
ncbi:MAG TPA: NAD-dependent epimerase/dehydratase family protein [Thermoanaerobaculia bacterium]|jgi:nucleoside-diphosphate-sugar epimerase